MNKYEQFTKIYLDNRRKIISYFKSTIRGHKSIAEDLAQDTFLKFWRYYNQENADIKSDIGLLYTIANSIRADYFRKSKLSTIPLEKVEFKLSTKRIESEINLDDFGFTVIERIITVHKMNGCSSQEISRYIGMPASTVRNKISEIKKKIKKYYAN